MSLVTGDNNGQLKYTKNGVNTNVSVKGLGTAAYTNSNAYAAASHNHDDRYYTESEVNTLLNNKSYLLKINLPGLGGDVGGNGGSIVVAVPSFDIRAYTNQGYAFLGCLFNATVDYVTTGFRIDGGSTIRITIVNHYSQVQNVIVGGYILFIK